MTIILRAGKIITASETFVADIRIEGEIIAEISAHIDAPEEAEILDAKGKVIMPGGVDAHVHLNLPMAGTVCSDDHYTGHKAAAFGGTTTALDFIPQNPGALKENVKLWHDRADHIAAIDFGFHMNITNLTDEIEREIPSLLGEGITSLKVFMAYNGNMRLSDGEIFRVMRIAKQNGMLTMLHAENGDVIEILVKDALSHGRTTPEFHAHTRPAWGAVEAFLRGAALAAQTDANLYVVHMNTAGEVDQLQYTRQRGISVMGETCLAYLFFSEEDLKRRDGSKWVCSPPMRTKSDQQALWDGLAQGLIQTVATDHCPFFFDGTTPIEYEGINVKIAGKELGAQDFSLIPNGLPGIGDRLPILWTYGVCAGRINANQFVALTSTNPAKIFGIYPQKGSLLPGSDADLVVWNPERKLKYGLIYSKHRTDYNLYEGWDLTGFPEKVMLRGKWIVDGDKWLGKPGQGKYLFRKPNAPLV